MPRSIFFIILSMLIWTPTLWAGQDIPVILEKQVAANSNQALVVESSGKDVFKAQVSLWQRSKQGWEEVYLHMDAVIGRNGTAPRDQKREGDGRTPSGVYRLGTAFGYAPSMDTSMAYRQVSDDDIWVDDPHSKQYNHLGSLQKLRGAKSFERMKRRDDLYKAGLVIEYNTDPVVKDKGSAIFLHIWRGPQSPTAGCVALSEENIFKILKWLNPSQNPMIVIV